MLFQLHPVDVLNRDRLPAGVGFDNEPTNDLPLKKRDLARYDMQDYTIELIALVHASGDITCIVCSSQRDTEETCRFWRKWGNSLEWYLISIPPSIPRYPFP